MKIITRIWLLCMLLSFTAAAQQDWEYLYDEQQDRAAELFNHYYFNKNYKEAVVHLEWLLSETPAASPSYFSQGIEVYAGLSRSASNPDERIRYAMLSLRLYDGYIQFFGDSSRMLNLKLQQAYQLLHNDSSQYPLIKRLSLEVMELTDNHFAHYNFVPTMQFFVMLLQKGQADKNALRTLMDKFHLIARHPDNHAHFRYREALENVKLLYRKTSLPESKQ
ncbi:MAG: hypothetical protein ACLFUB_01720 [Cyclobacteriaceae bacterium]